MLRKGAPAFLSMIAWGCFAVIFADWLRLTKERCQRFNELVAECLAPATLPMALLAVVFVLANAGLLWLALRR